MLKSFFPGDPDFSFERYPDLPYAYVLLAVSQGSDAHQKALHEMERPIALNTTVLAAQNRDPKKGKPPTYTDFCFYKPIADGDRPDHIYGSAYVRLIEQKRLPSWTLFCYKELSSCALSGYEPETCALIAEDAVLLHPERVGQHSYEGLLLAQESASGKRRKFINDRGEEIILSVPQVGTKLIAQEGVVLS